MEMKDWISLGALVVSFFTFVYTVINNNKQRERQSEFEAEQTKLKRDLQDKQLKQEKDMLERESNLRKELQQDQFNFQRKQVWYERQNEVIDNVSASIQELFTYSKQLLSEEIDNSDDEYFDKVRHHLNETLKYININNYYMENDEIIKTLKNAVQYFDIICRAYIDEDQDKVIKNQKYLTAEVNIFIDLIGEDYLRN